MTFCYFYQSLSSNSSDLLHSLMTIIFISSYVQMNDREVFLPEGEEKQV